MPAERRAPSSPDASLDHSRNSLMWINDDRVFYTGLLGAPSVRTMGSLILYTSLAGQVHVSLAGGPWQTTALAVIPPYVPHRIACDARLICSIHVEPETVDLAAQPALLRHRGPVEAPEFVRGVRACHAWLRDRGREIDLRTADFDERFFGARLAPRTVDPRIAAVLDRIRRDPSLQVLAEDCAAEAGLSFSRFLHLFKAEVGAPFRSLRTWKRARSLLHYVHRESNLAHVALDVGYPDSTHFSHSIRQVYGLKPKDIFAGSRKLAMLGHAAPGEAPRAH